MQNISEFIETELKLVSDSNPLESIYRKFFDLYLKKQNKFQSLNISHDALFMAFTHKSFSHENRVLSFNNERLEFLGDSVLQLYITQKLINDFPDLAEGKLSKLRSSLVNENTLVLFAKELSIEQFLLVGKGERKEAGYLKNSLLSDAFEAMLGAIYKSTSIEVAFKFLEELLSMPKFEKLFDLEGLNTFDYKSRLQEIVMKKYKTIPNYQVTESEYEKQKVFVISVWIGEEKLAQIESPSKKKGMQNIAKLIIENKKYEEVNYVN